MKKLSLSSKARAVADPERIGPPIQTFVLNHRAEGLYLKDEEIALIDFRRIDAHALENELDGRGLYASLEATVHEYLHHRFPDWSEKRIDRYWLSNVTPRLEFLRKFTRGLEV